MQTEWLGLRSRIERRLIRVLDISSILVCDLVVIGFGYAAVSIARHLSSPDSRFFNIAKQLSEAAFLLLYVIMVLVDCGEFLLREARENRSTIVSS